MPLHRGQLSVIVPLPSLAQFRADITVVPHGVSRGKCQDLEDFHLLLTILENPGHHSKQRLR